MTDYNPIFNAALGGPPQTPMGGYTPQAPQDQGSSAIAWARVNAPDLFAAWSNASTDANDPRNKPAIMRLIEAMFMESKKAGPLGNASVGQQQYGGDVGTRTPRLGDWWHANPDKVSPPPGMRY
jgi:hypothetical protein